MMAALDLRYLNLHDTGEQGCCFSEGCDSTKDLLESFSLVTAELDGLFVATRRNGEQFLLLLLEL